MEVRVLGGEFSDVKGRRKKGKKDSRERWKKKERNVLDFKPIWGYNRR